MSTVHTKLEATALLKGIVHPKKLTYFLQVEHCAGRSFPCGCIEWGLKLSLVRYFPTTALCEKRTEIQVTIVRKRYKSVPFEKVPPQ